MRRNNKRDGYSKLAANQNNYNYNFDKEKFVQAGLKFVLKNPMQDGGCKIKKNSTDQTEFEENDENCEDDESTGQYL